jgi:hypothetical protein
LLFRAPRGLAVVLVILLYCPIVVAQGGIERWENGEERRRESHGKARPGLMRRLVDFFGHWQIFSERRGSPTERAPTELWHRGVVPISFRAIAPLKPP